MPVYCSQIEVSEGAADGVLCTVVLADMVVFSSEGTPLTVPRESTSQAQTAV